MGESHREMSSRLDSFICRSGINHYIRSMGCSAWVKLCV